MGKLYILVTADELELPVIVAGTVRELARQMGRQPDVIRNAIWRGGRVCWEHGWYRAHRVADTEGDENVGAYPCKECNRKGNCVNFRDCDKWREWVTDAWDSFQQQAQAIRQLVEEAGR